MWENHFIIQFIKCNQCTTTFNHTVLHTDMMFLVQRQNNECVFACMCVYVCVHEQACLKKLPVSIMSGLD